jgi:hypothetical protein
MIIFKYFFFFLIFFIFNSKYSIHWGRWGELKEFEREDKIKIILIGGLF